ncbi:uncharacterized protein LOC119733851 [Patiria miniata]|uniref:Uncharacterized protein n=1 Tax=Patiria miniata TaxID=46514 RepID=A0A914AHY0_PATMI|nr:uncharacterized protein LOC119733851 [Patiria miniata]
MAPKSVPTTTGGLITWVFQVRVISYSCKYSLVHGGGAILIQKLIFNYAFRYTRYSHFSHRAGQFCQPRWTIYFTGCSVQELCLIRISKVHFCCVQSQIVFDARKILMEHPKGPTIIKEYHKNRYICPGSRMTLVSVLVAHLIAKCGSYPTIEEKHALGRSVITLFPNLSDSSGKTGYEHFFCSAGGQSGYIQDKLKNMRRSLPQSAKLRMKKDTPKPCPKEDLPCKLLPESEAEELESFCRNALGDRNKTAVTKAMAQSAPNRRAWINAEEPFLSVILQKYPRFMDMPELIDQDFKAIFSDPADNLLQKWANHAQMLLTYASTCKQERVVKVHQDFRAQTSRKTEELTALYGFLVLLRLLPSYNTKAKGRVSCEDVDRLLVKFFEVNVPLEETLHDKTTKQPTLVVLGTKSSMEQILLKIEEFGFHLPSTNITAAVDLLFKSHYIFNLEYSPQLFNFFLYLQTQIYGLEYTGKLPPRVTEIAMALKAL